MIINSYRYAGGAAPSGLLLDDYPNAAAAYALRKLRTAYAGDAIRVRESGGNTEADIGFDGSGNLDTTALLAHCGANDGFVVTWYDQSGNALDATQAIIANQTQIVSSGSTILENGLPAIYFNGSNNYFDLPSTAMTNPAVDDYKSVIAVVGIDRTSTDTLVYEVSYASLQQVAGSFNRGSSNSFQTRTNFGSVNDDSQVLSKDQNLIVHISQASANTNNSYLDGNSFSGVLPGRSLGSQNRLGAGFAIVNFYKGTFQEFIFYNADQSSNRNGIETNINNHYNIYP